LGFNVKGHKKKINLKNPISFNEKIQWLKLFWHHPLVVECGDKFTLRKYVEQNNCKEVLNDIYGVYDSPLEINWENLPNKFVLKVSNGCGYNIICTNKKELDITKSIQKLTKWIKTDYSLIAAEIHYSKMIPKIICEKFIVTDNGYFPVDYKMYCFNGKVHCTMVCIVNDVGKRNFVFYNLDWTERLAYDKSSFSHVTKVDKPKSYDQMLRYAEILSKPFPFVRMDFYDLDGSVILGEMTFTPGGGLDYAYTKLGEQVLGDLLTLPEKKI
jgi:hypothetical protein